MVDDLTSADPIFKIMLSVVPKRAGDKPWNKKPRKGKNNVSQVPVIEVIDNVADPELDVQKPQRIRVLAQ